MSVLFFVVLAACNGDGGAGHGSPAVGATPNPPSKEPAPVRIASDAFGFLDDESGSHETVVLSGAFDTDVAVGALRRAGDRFMLIDEEGTEYATGADLEAATLRGPKYLYSPNYVADPKVLDRGIELYVDCKGVIEPPMAAAFRRILREELDRARITNAVVNNAFD